MTRVKNKDQGRDVAALLRELGDKRYGLRWGWQSAVARDLELAPAQISKILHGNIRVSRRLAARMFALSRPMLRQGPQHLHGEFELAAERGVLA